MVVRRAALLATRDTIDAEDLPADVREPAAAAPRPARSLAEMERDYIESVLRSNGGHRGRTARMLGIDPKTLYNKLGPERPRRKA
jgi:DNA-binding NtrC family response regulator